ncbi:MAG: hypothetical protein MJZ25_03295 [Fibrobacter sp.]|nr:hypothetical protein [Fibrobacter sp.]
MRNTITRILEEYTRSWEVMTIKDPSDPAKTIDVVPPYVMNVDNYVKPEHRKDRRWEGSKNEPGYLQTLDKLQKELPNPDNVDPYDSSRGKCRPEVLKAFLETDGSKLLAEGRFKDLRAALIHYAVGIDCSGFVSRALGRVMRLLDIPLELRWKTLGYNTDKVDHFEPDSNRPYRSNCTVIENGGSDFVSPENILPGDILCNRKGKNFHVRVVLETLKNNGDEYYFITAESSAAVDKLRVLRKKWKYVKSSNRMFYRFLDKLECWTEETNWNKKDVKFEFRRPKAFENIDPRSFDYVEDCGQTSAQDYSSFVSRENNAITNSRNVNLRPDCSTKHSAVAVIPKNELVTVDFGECFVSDSPKAGSKWYRAYYHGKAGYLCDITFEPVDSL